MNVLISKCIQNVPGVVEIPASGGHNTCHTSPRSVESHDILHQNACGYIKMNVLISKCIQTVPPVLKIFTGGGTTLVTLLREVL